MPYQLGVTQANMQDLTDLGLPDPLFEPLSDFNPFTGERQRGSGEIVGTGLPQFSWRFNRLSLTQLGALLHYVTDESGNLVRSRTVYVQTRVPVANMTDRVFRSYRAFMLLPVEPSDARYDRQRVYENVTVRFIQAVELS